jgi:hypothetical protein
LVEKDEHSSSSKCGYVEAQLQPPKVLKHDWEKNPANKFSVNKK